MERILFVDIGKNNLECIGEELLHYFQLERVCSVEQMFIAAKEFIPKLILVHCNSFEVDEYNILRLIKCDSELATTPVVLMLDANCKKSEWEGLQLGAADAMTGPFEVRNIVSRVHKVLAEEKERNILSTSAKRDNLTGLWNRNYMEEKVRELLQEPNPTGALLLLDMDNFKEINDLYGHVVGDKVLIQFSESLIDFVAKDNIVCRFGGDEFAVYLKGPITIADIRKKAEGLLEHLEKRLIEFIEIDEVSVSIGIAIVPNDGLAFEELYNKADKALYFVKQNGKRGYHLFMDKDVTAYSFLEGRNIAINLDQLKSVIEEKIALDGAYRVPYGGFKSIYQFISRCIKRTNQQVQFVLFTLTPCTGSTLKIDEVNDCVCSAMKNLEKTILKALRRGDVATRFGSFQYVVILMDASTDNGKKVAERIMQSWNKINETVSIEISFDIEEVKTATELDMVQI